MIKRTFDIVSSGVGLILLSPLLIVVALLVKLTSRGPVLFRQERVGRHFKPFRMNKFRSMVPDAPSRGAQITAGRDPRITRVGAVLRATKIDELPQLFNVLVGDMSVVGPRPEVPRYVEMYRDRYAEVLSVRPGITDLASLKYRDESALLGEAEDPEALYVNEILPDKIELAREYIRRKSFWFDMSVILQTFWKIVRS
ncbi:MAG: sugar transferase [Pirellulales bacterium]|nr:sugar transferase [Planctomycetales bacterium]